MTSVEPSAATSGVDSVPEITEAATTDNTPNVTTAPAAPAASTATPIVVAPVGTPKRRGPEKISAIEFPPAHVNVLKITFGTWVKAVESRPSLPMSSMEAFLNTFGKGSDHKANFLFTRRRLEYVFDPPALVVAGGKQLFKVVIPFESISGFYVNEGRKQMLVQVDSPPLFFKGTTSMDAHGHAQAHRWNHDPETAASAIAATNELVLRAALHLLDLKSVGVNIRNIKQRLSNFDPAFAQMIQHPTGMITATATTLLPDLPVQTINSPTTSSTKKRKSSSATADDDEASSSTATSSTTTPTPKRNRTAKPASNPEDVKCKCTTGCRDKKCSCIKVNGACEPSKCTCKNCVNPFTLLKNSEVKGPYNDECLIDNICKIKDLPALLAKKVQLDCGCEISMTKGIHGRHFQCDCGGTWQYSWCDDCFHSEEEDRRNHCEICKSCRDHRDQHCEKCNKCFFAGSMGSFKCPCRETRRNNPAMKALRVMSMIGLAPFPVDMDGGEDDEDDDGYNSF